MQRKLIIVLIGIIFVLAGVTAILFLRGQPGSPSRIVLNEAGGNEANPYQAELDCIDRVIERNDMDANEVQPAMANCRASSEPGNRSSEQ